MSRAVAGSIAFALCDPNHCLPDFRRHRFGFLIGDRSRRADDSHRPVHASPRSPVSRHWEDDVKRRDFVKLGAGVASNAIYPRLIMPPWLHTVARVNPLSDEVDVLRALMIVGGTSTFDLVAEYGLLTGTTALLVVVASYVYPRVVG
jgi:hypothetical protein